MVICAACRQPIVTRQQIKIIGYEVVHAGCVGRETVSQALHRRSADIEVRLARLESNDAALRGQVTRLQMERADVEREWRRVKAERDEARVQQANAVAQIATANRERDAAREELAKIKAKMEGTPDPVDDRDPVVVRFGLLEMD